MENTSFLLLWMARSQYLTHKKEKNFTLWVIFSPLFSSDLIKSKTKAHPVAARCLAFSSDSSLLFSGSDDKHIKMFDVHHASLISSFSGHTSFVLSLDVFGDSKRFASSSSDQTVKIWDIGQRSVTDTLSEHEDQVWSVKISPNGEQVVSVGSDDRMILHSL